MLEYIIDGQGDDPETIRGSISEQFSWHSLANLDA